MKILITVESSEYNYLQSLHGALAKKQEHDELDTYGTPRVSIDGQTITIEAGPNCREPLRDCFKLTTAALWDWVIPTGWPESSTLINFMRKLMLYSRDNDQELIQLYLDLLEPVTLERPDYKITLQARYPAEKTIVFIEGPDGVGKSSLIAAFPQCRTVAEMGSIPSSANMYLPETNTKQLVLKERSRVPCPSRDMHYTFAERWHIWTSVVDHPELQFTLCDRSWITGYIYQGLEEPRLYHIIKNEGLRLDRYLRQNRFLPIYLVLNNPPYRDDVSDSLEHQMDEKKKLYKSINMEDFFIFKTDNVTAEKLISQMLN